MSETETGYQPETQIIFLSEKLPLTVLITGGYQLTISEGIYCLMLT